MVKPARHLVTQMQIFSVFTDHLKNQFLKKMNDNDLNMHLHDKIVGLASLLGKGTSIIEMSNSAYNIQNRGRSCFCVLLTALPPLTRQNSLHF